MGDVVAERFVEPKVYFANFCNVQVLSDYDKHSIAECEEKHTGLDSDPRETAHPEASFFTDWPIVNCVNQQIESLNSFLIFNILSLVYAISPH